LPGGPVAWDLTKHFVLCFGKMVKGGLVLGLDQEKLTYRYAGRDFRLTDVHGNVVKGLSA